MVNWADDPLSDGLLWFWIIWESALPNPAAQICPARGLPGSNLAEHFNHPGMFWISVICVFGGETTFTLKFVLTLLPFLSVARISI